MLDLNDSRTLRRRKGRRSRVMILVLVITGGALGAITPLLVRWSKNADLLPIREMVVTGAAPERVEEIKTYAEVADGAPILKVNLRAVAKRVETHPFVKIATLRWLPPDALEISIVEREPALAVAIGGLYLADDGGEIFKRRRAGEGIDLPVVTGLKTSMSPAEQRVALLTSLRVLKAHSAAGAPGGVMQQLHHDQAGLSVTLQSGLEVRLGKQGFEDRFQRLRQLLHRLQESGQAAEWVHMNDDRRPERVAVRLRPLAEMPADTGTKEHLRERMGTQG